MLVSSSCRLVCLSLVDCCHYCLLTLRRCRRHHSSRAQLWPLLLAFPSCACQLSMSSCCFLSSSRFACKSLLLLSTSISANLTVSPFFLLVLACTMCCITRQSISLKLSLMMCVSTVHAGSLIAKMLPIRVPRR